MNIEPLTPQDLRNFHDYGLEVFGGSSGEHDPGMIDYTATKPFEFIPFTDPATEQYPGLYQKAAVYMHSLATHQYFVDGNKRTAYISAATFLEFNGYILFVSDDEMYYVSKLVSNSTSEVYNTGWDLKRLTRWIEENVVSAEEFTDEMEEQRELRQTSTEVEREFEIMEMVLFIHEKTKEMRPSLKDIDTLELILSTATKTLFNRPSGDNQRRIGQVIYKEEDASSHSPKIIIGDKLTAFNMPVLGAVQENKDTEPIINPFASIARPQSDDFRRLRMVDKLRSITINMIEHIANCDYIEAEKMRIRQTELIQKLKEYDNQ